MDGVWANMDQYIQLNIASEGKAEAGLITVHKRPEYRNGDGALVRYTGGRLRRLSRRGCRAGGYAGRGDGGSFRGWK